LDLLLFLIRRSEVDIYDIPIARITQQYLAYINVLKEIDPDLVGDFLVMAATLMEIKSRMLLPNPPAEEIEEEDFGDPRLELVRQLLEYKTFKDAARTLDAALEEQSHKHPRVPVNSLPKEGDVDLEEVQIWDLLDAFQKVLDATGRKQKKHEVVYDDTPIALHAADVLDALERAGGSQTFQVLFDGRTKSQMIGLFLALLELIRQRRVRAVQAGRFGPIELQLLDASPIQVDEEADYRSAIEPKDELPAASPSTDEAYPAEADTEAVLDRDPNADNPETLSETFRETR
jgi:segregation and condensation protein A